MVDAPHRVAAVVETAEEEDDGVLEEVVVHNHTDCSLRGHLWSEFAESPVARHSDWPD